MNMSRIDTVWTLTSISSDELTGKLLSMDNRRNDSSDTEQIALYSRYRKKMSNDKQVRTRTKNSTPKYTGTFLTSCTAINRYGRVLRKLSGVYFVSNKFIFYNEGFLAPHPTPKLDYHPLSLARSCLFNLFASTFHSCGPLLLPQPEDAPCCGGRGPI
jgi:hypothetical protein